MQTNVLIAKGVKRGVMLRQESLELFRLSATDGGGDDESDGEYAKERSSR
ncbi:MAG: hypothetical protein AB8H86_01650 [Polyangiales bacterium]